MFFPKPVFQASGKSIHYPLMNIWIFRRIYFIQKQRIASWSVPRWGTGFYPTHDAWGRAFSKEYCKDRWRLGGQKICGQFVACLEGIQGDQDYIRTMMTPERTWVDCKNILGGCCLKVFFAWKTLNPQVIHFIKNQVSTPSNFVATIAGHANGYVLVMMQGWSNTSTQTLGNKQLTGTRP